MTSNSSHSDAAGAAYARWPQENHGRLDPVLFTFECVEFDRHEQAGHDVLSRRLASTLGYPFGGNLDSSTTVRNGYLVPRRPLVRAEVETLGLTDELAIFGGWTLEAFMATKAIMHPLVADPLVAPSDWPYALCAAARSITLLGHTVFAREDALVAARALLGQCGQIRLKPVYEDGGRGQGVFDDLYDLQEELERLDDMTVSLGLVIEENLKNVETLSVGQVRVPGATVSYLGTQSTTHDNNGRTVYGGSDLCVVRGGFDRLPARPMPPVSRHAIKKAAEFDGLADKHLPNFAASRRNYDVAFGVGWDNVLRVGVLEQSWRIGGASGAEILALEAFAHDPRLTTVHARTVERYGGKADAPPDAMIIYKGDDSVVGSLLKYAVAEGHFED